MPGRMVAQEVYLQVLEKSNNALMESLYEE